jgi:hypothetical protein
MPEFIPTVKKVETHCGMCYSQCKATVHLEYPSSSGVCEMVVEYPMQGDKHMTILLEDTTGRKLDHPSRIKIANAINEVIKQ